MHNSSEQFKFIDFLNQSGGIIQNLSSKIEKGTLTMILYLLTRTIMVWSNPTFTRYFTMHIQRTSKLSVSFFTDWLVFLNFLQLMSVGLVWKSAGKCNEKLSFKIMQHYSYHLGCPLVQSSFWIFTKKNLFLILTWLETNTTNNKWFLSV